MDTTLFDTHSSFTAVDAPPGVEELTRRMDRVNALIQNPVPLARVWPDGTDEAELHQALFAAAPDALLIMDRSMAMVDANPGFARLLGYSSPEELQGFHAWDWDARFSREELEAFGRLPVFGTRTPMESLFRRKDGSLTPVEIHACGFVLRGREMAFCAVRDISERKQAEKALHAREQEVRSLVEHSPDCIIRYDREYVRVYANPAALRTMHQQSGNFVGEVIGGGPVLDKATYKATLQRVLESGQEAELELQYRTQKGETAWGLTRFSPEFDHENRVVSVLAITRDITEMVRQREELHRLAFYDHLTGLPNRALLRDRMRQEAAERTRRGGLFSLMVLDIDNFKDINDTLGHAAGDRMLRETARRLTECLRDHGTLSRLGGDEFAVLLPDILSSQDMGAVARLLLDALTKPLRIGDQDVFSSASVGIAIYPDDSRKLNELFACADVAMYQAKAKGRNTFQFYDSKLTAAAELRLSLGSALRHALARGELEVYYQPKVSMPEGRVLGAEALLRWNHPGLGLLTPDKFIAIAEDTGLIIDIGQWVLEQACAAVTRWNRCHPGPLHVAVNLSGRQFVQNDLAGSVRETLAATGCRGVWLELEITESLMLDDNPDIQGVLEALSDLGASIAIDDFGTGHSALSYLNRFRVDVLKIDRSFVTGLEHDRRKAELVKAFIAVARALGMRLVAEGVELPEQAEFLCANGCAVAQGYLYGRPVPLRAFEALLAQAS